jgi:hypothetical protein
MTCSEARQEIGERVHNAGWAEGPLAGHLQVCGECGAEWEAHQDLVRHFDAIRRADRLHRPPLDRRAQLMRQFTAIHAAQHPKPAARQQFWTWAVAAAAMLLLGVSVAPRVWDLWTAQHTVTVADDGAAEGDDTEDFIAVPYAPALAAGEVLRVVRTELYPAALASLGVDLDPSLTGKMPADLLVGEDGYPRAVRVSAEAESNF